jgi:hypothetical protein
MLSSDEYPTPPVCSKLEATKIAKNSVLSLLRRLKHKQKVSRVIVIES